MDDFQARALKNLKERHEDKIRQDAARIQEYIGYEREDWEARDCLLPDCKASFDIRDVFAGIDAANGWRLLKFFGAVYLCPDHAGLCVSGRHVPSWSDLGAARGLTGVGCSCGWKWRPEEPSTMGEHRDKWAAHLADESAAAAAGGNAG